jgi:Domain of unknown function (DUF4159)
MRNRRAIVPLLVAAGVAAAAAVVFAQRIWVGGPGGGFNRVPPKWATPADFDGSFVYCRGFYNSVHYEQSGSGWNTDYPGADNNFSVRLMELTSIHVKVDSDRQPNYVVVSLSDPLLYHCPMLFMEDIGTAGFSDQEVVSLREFFLKGGFLWVDDSWGSRAWSSWVAQISRILPPSEFPIFDIPLTHPILHTLYDVKEVPQVPAISFWRRSSGRTSERGPDSDEVYFKGIQDARGRLMVLMTHNTDIADTWEREGEPPHDYFDLFSPRGYAIGVNVVLYAMTH